jgi:hypothetical protein
MRDQQELVDAAPVGPETAEAEGRERGGEDRQPERLVRVTEAIPYRRRAQAAEKQLEDLAGKLQEAEAELGHSREEVGRLERQQKIDRLLAESEAIDLEAARLLTEAAVEGMDEPDVEAAVEDLRRHKPYLFRQRGPMRLTMGARSQTAPQARAEDAAAEAKTSGSRRDLLRYLRLRRKGLRD